MQEHIIKYLLNTAILRNNSKSIYIVLLPICWHDFIFISLFNFAFFLFTICFFSVNIFLSTFFNFLLPKFIFKASTQLHLFSKTVNATIKKNHLTWLLSTIEEQFIDIFEREISWVIVWRKTQKSDTDCETIAAHHVRFFAAILFMPFCFQMCVCVCVCGCGCVWVCVCGWVWVDEVKWEWELELVYF